MVLPCKLNWFALTSGLGFAGQDGLVDFEAVSLTLVIVVELLLDGKH